MLRRMGWMLLAALAANAHVAATAAPAPGVAPTPAMQTPAWLFPLNPPAPPAAPDPVRLQHLPGSDATFTWPQLKNLFAAVDWYPDTHTTMPQVVSHGRPPRVSACGYCHTPGGQGRPENAPLAALPAAYIVQQVADFKSGARRNPGPADFRPNGLMVQVAAAVGPEDLAAAAAYFAAQPLRRRVVVRERARVPRLGVVGMVYARVAGGGDEPLGERLLEMSPDARRHEMRDEDMPYVVYVPPGSVARGRILATAAGGAACGSCHGERLQGVGLVPRLAGVSPSYVLRQLIGFQSGARRTPAGAPMQAVVAHLSLGSMIDAAAYAASLPTDSGPAPRRAAGAQAALSAE